MKAIYKEVIPKVQPPYTEEEIQKFYDGTDPQYPNTNWFDYIFDKWAPQQQHNVSVRGGSENIKYYGFLGMLDQETMFKRGGSGYKRYNLISNIDARISEQFSFTMNLNTNFGITKAPWRGLDDGDYTVWEDYWNTQPVFPTELPDPTKLSWAVGSNTGGAHIMGNRDIAGYRDRTSQNIMSTVALSYNSTLLKGLHAKAFFNINQDYSSLKEFVRPVQFYTYNYEADLYKLEGALGSAASLSQSESKNRVLTGQFSVGYDKKIGLHDISFIAVHEIADYYYNSLYGYRNEFLTPLIEEIRGGSTTGMRNDGSTSEMGRKSYVGRLSYNYDTRYLMDINFRADASAKYPKETRWGYFPGVTVAWRMNKEKFMQTFSDNLQDLKLRLSYGTAGIDDVGNFDYMTGYKIATDPSQGMAYSFGNSGYPGLVALGMPNPNLTWEKTTTMNAGVDFSLWRNKLYGTVDVFYRERTGIPAYRRSSLPSTFGADLPIENLNSIANRGFETKLGTSGSSKNWVWDLSSTLSWSRAKWKYYDEPEFTDEAVERTDKRTGRWTDIVYGYKTDGLFMSQEEIDNLGYNQDGNATPNSSLRPGDIKYVNINGDDKIDRQDVVALGKGTMPHWMFGLNANLRYKNFDLSTLFQGAFGYYTAIYYFGGVAPQVRYNERWTEGSTNRYALIPRLGGRGLGPTSDYNYKKAGYLRLKTFAVGYTVPYSVIKPIGLENVRVFVAGVNFFTFDKLKKYQLDPESPSGRGGHYYPQQKTISIGLNVSL
ncbi:MAG: SusC/RagA family TonB-linked outer membrane protein [Niabella sp.]